MDYAISAGRPGWTNDTSEPSYSPVSTPVDSAIPYISPDAKDYASQTQAWLTQRNYQDYISRYYPHELAMLDAIKGRDLLDQRLSAITTNFDNSFGSSMSSQQNSMKRYGVQRDARESSYDNTTNALAKAAAIGSAENSTRQAIQERNMNLIIGGPTRTTITGSQQ
ncbi:MAG: hypothetical protein ACK2UP_11250 [Candidatus Promineifilaceae bacterium]